MERRNVSIRAKSDRLSSLPDSLLCHILSFIPTAYSVATSALARRYRFLWADVVNLDFDCRGYDMEFHGISFADTVNRVLLLSNVRDINSFRLVLLDYEFREVNLFESWIRTIVARNVQTFDILLRKQVQLPRCLFTCKTLVDLRLKHCQTIRHDVFLPNVKRLHLHSVQFGNGKKLQDLISGCPVLEELNIQQFVERELMRFIISSPSIKLLTLKFTYDEDFDHEEDIWDYRLEINTPAARYLVIEDYSSHHITTGTFNSLVEADLRLYDLEVTSVLGLVEKLHRIKCLKLAMEFIEPLDSSFDVATSKFINLTKLELATDWLILLKFLECADNLQVLIMGKFDDVDVRCWTEPQQVPTCLSSHLGQVTLNDFECKEAEFEIVSYILRHGKVLKTMDIISRKMENTDDAYSFLEEKFNALNRISAFERESKTCKLQFF